LQKFFESGDFGRKSGFQTLIALINTAKKRDKAGYRIQKLARLRRDRRQEKKGRRGPEGADTDYTDYTVVLERIDSS